MTNTWTKEHQKSVLETFFKECLRFWERELKVSSDDSQEPYKNAIRDIPQNDPYTPFNAPVFDPDIRDSFIKSRYMDCYGLSWKEHFDRHDCGERPGL